MTPAQFRRIVWAHYKKSGRHELPWRPPALKLRRGKEDATLYRILVSEVMLQQTQVDRVVPCYTNFIKKFPTAKKLAQAKLSDVLKAWQGLGYNRRAKMLHQSAAILQSVHLLSYRLKDERSDGKRLVTELEQLPGVGPYTARAVAAFAYNHDAIVIETNIRTAVIHHFFADRAAGIFSPRSARAARPILHLGKNMPAALVTDTEIAEVLERVLPKGKAREWYSALMDYGAHLKRSGISYNAKSKSYTKQSKFSGSLREARGALLKRLALGPASRAVLLKLFSAGRQAQVAQALDDLRREGLLKKSGRNFVLAD